MSARAYAPPTSRMLLVVENFAMGACYYGLGKLALLLAIPPGYASAIWPPAGLALAAMLAFRYRVWPGIFVGHFLVNLFPSFEASVALPFMNALSLALSIAAGGTLQAALGAFLIRRFVGYPNRLDKEKDIIFFLLLGGPVSCLVAATLGATTLLFLRLVPPSDYPFNWFTWWVGDVIGVMLVAPVLVIWAVGRQEATLRRQLSVTALLMVMLALVVVFFAASRRSEERRLELEFKTQAEALRSAVEKSLNAYLKLTESVANYYMSDSAVTSTDFSRFTAPLLAHHRGVQALGWYPRVDDAKRGRFEEAARRDGMNGFEIEELDPNGLMIRAARRQVYFPARQLEPHKANAALLGFDLASEAVTLEAVNEARDSGKPVISGPVRLLQATDGQDAIFILAPAFRPAATPVSVEHRRRDFMGVAAWLVRVSNVVPDAITGVVPDGIELRIEDNSARDEVLLYDSGPAPAKSAAAALQLESDQHLGARDWKLTFYPTEQYVLTQRGWLAWAFLIVGLLFTSLLSAFLILLTGHTAAVQRLVHERTAALEAANQELEAFSYSVAHDLRSPLGVVLGFGRLLSNLYRDKFDPKGRLYLDQILAGSMRMTTLIEDLLNLSRINRAPLCVEQINLSEMAAGIVADFRMRDPARQVVVEIAEGLTASCDKGLIKVALENLLGNAWKFTAKQPNARIAFFLEKKDETVFCVRDNGAGFDMKRAEKLFAPFQRLHQPSEFDGTGIGLATVARVISRHGGRIWVMAAVNEGATFFFTLGGRADLLSDQSNSSLGFKAA
jgi:signal transduction histidine kinase/integral membrane sensor domain MASE1